MSSVDAASVHPESLRSRARYLAQSLSILGWIGVVLTTVVLSVAMFGPFFAGDPFAFVGTPFGTPQEGFPLGFDFLGRDALSRFLWGGRVAVTISVLGYVIGATLGASLGLLSAYVRGPFDAGVSWLSEVLIGFPSLVMMMLLVASLGPSFTVLVGALAVVNFPRVLRIVRAAVLEVRDAQYVEIAEARGESRLYITFREIFPTVLPPFLVDSGIRISGSILLVASLSFLGLGVRPPAADWGLIISENRAGLQIQPWAVAGPIIALAFLMVGVNLTIDAIQGRRPGIARISQTTLE